MRKRAILALLLAAVLLAATGCSLIVKDEEVDKQTVVREIAGKAITKGELEEQTEYLLDYYDYMYSLYGMTFDRTNEETVASLREEALQSLLQSAVIEHKIAELGLDQFTAEEEAEMTASVEESYSSTAELIKTYMLSDSELTGEALDAEIEKQMVSLGYGTKAEMLESERLNRAYSKLEAEVVKDVTVTEDELTSEYGSRVESARSTYNASPASYGTDLTSGTTPYYTPAGYRYVKHILLTFSDEDQTILDDLNDKISDKQDELTTAAEDEQEALSAELAELEQQLETATENARQALQLTADEIRAKLDAGESFEALIDEYNQDPGMTADSVGYAVSADSTNWVTEFTEGAMALEKAGDVSEPVYSSYGLHIIQYAADIPEGEIGLENVRDALESELLSDKQDEYFSETVSAWVQEG